MKAEEHLHAEDWTRLRRRDLAPAEVLAVTSHLASCATCREDDRSQDGAQTILDQLLADSRDAHPRFETIAEFVDGTLTPDAEDAVDAHLGICARCTEDVADLRAVADSMKPRP